MKQSASDDMIIRECVLTQVQTNVIKMYQILNKYEKQMWSMCASYWRQNNMGLWAQLSANAHYAPQQEVSASTCVECTLAPYEIL